MPTGYDCVRRTCASGLATQARNEEPVKARETRSVQLHVEGQRPELAKGRKPIGIAADLARRDGRALELGPAREECRDLLHALLCLQRAGTVDEQSAGRDQRGCMREHAQLQRGHATDVLGSLQAQDVGMAADGPRGTAWRVVA